MVSFGQEEMMDIFWMIWHIARNVFGNIFVACVAMSGLILIIELLWYRFGRRKGEDR